METKTNYFQVCVRRENHLKNFIFDMALSAASYPKLLLECFIRRNFGVRYFSLAANLTVAFLLALFPVVADKLSFLSNIHAHYKSYEDYNEAHSLGLTFWFHYATWYLFLAVFLYITWKRWQEVRHKPGVFDTSRFSLYSGDINDVFFRLHPLGIQPSVRGVETIYEPAVFFLAGFVLHYMGQHLGGLLMLSSVIYSLSYFGQYQKGDNFFLDLSDQRLLAKEYEDAFLRGNYNNAHGVRFHMSRPTDQDLARDLKSSIVGTLPEDEAPTFAE